ncbi:MAG: helix-turn-helix transcriptional regulator [Thermoplasmata archaeon]
MAMEKLCSLLFELSNEDRLRILHKVEEESLRLTHVAEKLDLTVQETSRHLSRLSEEKLVQRGADGLYRLTAYGEHAVRLLPGLRFLSEHGEYFATHNTSHLPDEFVKRIGDLANCTFTDDVMEAFHIVESLIQEAREYVWILTDQILMSTLPFLEEAIKRGVAFRLIVPEDMVPPPDFKPIPGVTDLIKRRTLKRVDAVMTISEKLARVAFPTVEGRMDYIGFGSTDESSYGWCRELLLYYWERSEPGKPKGYPPLH